ncbi:MAG TPA: alpha/beta hydrolase [Stellaceae bacterium]|jgi:pimeloyl-ACP methyl ester carboxylesterase
MPLASTTHGALHFEVIDRVAPGETARDPILFHHGIGASAGIWSDWLPALADRYRMVTFDMRGYGRSHIPAPDDAWPLDELIGDVFAVADAAGLKRFHLVGESIGGTIGLATALARPERIATLTVSNGAHLGASIERVDQWRRQLDEGGVKAWSDIFMRDRFHDGALSSECWARFAAQQEAWPRASILNALGVLVGADLSPELGQIACPVLLLHPDGSPFIPVPVAEALQRLLPDARLHIFPHARHGLPFSHAQDCVRLLRSFLDPAHRG